MIDKNRLKLGALAALSVCVISPAVAGKEDISVDVRDVVTRTSVAKQDLLTRSVTLKTKADRLMIAANEQLVDGNYKSAVELYLAAKKIFASQKGNVFVAELNSCNKRIEQAYFYWAQNLIAKADESATSKDYGAAIELCREAIKLFPENAKAYNEKISALEREKIALEAQETTGAAALLPDNGAQQYRISVLMAQAQKLVEQRMYDKAERKYNDILLIDPYNAVALNNLRAARIRSKKVGDERYNLQHRKMITELEWRWATPILPEGENEMENVIVSPFDKNTDKLNSLEEKIRNLTIPDATFEDISILTAIKKIQELSKANDPEGKGVNVFYRRALESEKTKDGDSAAQDKKSTPVAKAPEAPPTADDDMGGDFADDVGDFADDVTETVKDVLVSDDDTPKVSVVLTNRTVYDALNLLCKTADLQMRVERYAVVLAPKDVALDELETRVFPVEKSVFDGVDLADETALANYFIERGIPFPEGATAVYDTKISRLIATNTLGNLLRMDTVLQELQSSKPAMVEITAKFIEITQNDLKELGFDYTVAYNPGNKGIDATSNHRLSFQDSMTDIMRRATDGQGNESQDLFTIVGKVGGEDGFSYTAKVFAQDKASSSDVLASPRVTTLENTTAHIEMVKEESFADDYEASETDTYSNDDGGFSESIYIGPFINYEEPTPLGIKMDVTPRVDKTRRIIQVAMNPTLTAFLGFDEYESANSDGEVELMKKPIIKSRTISTNVTIYDGETIVLGGVIEDQTKIIDDKIPILGDLPLVGRLFQSKSTVSEKRNLLIFMTCRLVKPDGKPLYPSKVSNRGLPEVSRLD